MSSKLHVGGDTGLSKYENLIEVVNQQNVSRR